MEGLVGPSGQLRNGFLSGLRWKIGQLESADRQKFNEEQPFVHMVIRKGNDGVEEGVQGGP